LDMWVEIELRAASTGSKPVDCLSIFSPHQCRFDDRFITVSFT
jgi:hypothetical protein